MRLRFAGRSHVGLVRDHNEDAGFAGPTCLLVADGVGGSAAGEVAAATAAQAVLAAVMGGAESLAARLRGAIRVAREQIRAGIEADPARAGMATTLTAVATDGDRFMLAHLGDSRGYVLRDRDLTRITQDHTYVQALIESGNLDDDAARSHPWRHMVLRVVNGGDGPDGDPDLLELSLLPGDRVLLASDGLTDLVSEEEIRDAVVAAADQSAVSALVDTALARGGRDNITCVLGTVADGDGGGESGLMLGALADPANLVESRRGQAG